MSQSRRSWVTTFADKAVLSDARAAAIDCMRQVCAHKPHGCDCPENRMTPAEFVDWLEAEVLAAERDPVRFESGFRPRMRNEANLSAA